MNIEPLNNPIDPKRQAGLTDQQQRVRTDRPAPAEGTQQASQAAPAADTVNIETQPQLIRELTETLAGMEDAPRQDMVERIRSRIEDGTYNSAEMIRRVAESMLPGDILTD